MSVSQESTDRYGYDVDVRSVGIYSEQSQEYTCKDTECFYTFNDKGVIVQPGKSKDMSTQLYRPLQHLREGNPRIQIGPKWNKEGLKIQNGLSLTFQKTLGGLTKSFFGELPQRGVKEICLAVPYPLTTRIRCQVTEACEECGYYVKSIIPKPEAYACDVFTHHPDLLEESNTIRVIVFGELSIQTVKVTRGNGCLTSDYSRDSEYGYEWLQNVVCDEFSTICGAGNGGDEAKMELIKKVDRYLETGETDSDHNYDSLSFAMEGFYGKIKEYVKKSLLNNSYPVVLCGFIHKLKNLKEYLCNNLKEYDLHPDIDPIAARGAVLFVKQNRKMLNAGIQEMITSPQFIFGYQINNKKNVIIEKGRAPQRPKMEMWKLRKPADGVDRSEATRELTITFFREDATETRYRRRTIKLLREVTENDTMCFEVWTVDENTIYFHIRIDSEILFPLTKIDIRQLMQ